MLVVAVEGLHDLAGELEGLGAAEQHDIPFDAEPEAVVGHDAARVRVVGGDLGLQRVGAEQPGGEELVPGVGGRDALQGGQLGADPGGEFPAALRVKVTPRTSSGRTQPLATSHTTRSAMVAVFPEPAPAMTSRGVRGEEMIRDCSAVGLFFSPSRADSSSGLNRGCGKGVGQRCRIGHAGSAARGSFGNLLSPRAQRADFGQPAAVAAVAALGGIVAGFEGAAGHHPGGVVHHLQRPVLLRVQRGLAPGRPGSWWWCRAGPGRPRRAAAAARRRARQSLRPARPPGRRPAAGGGRARLCRAAVCRS